ncbi:MAG TPA: hypothetical protein VEX63_03685 [Flavisolibacter sp.]|nr:hypothetical protein [Flavisolibacter sp.]
MENYYLFRNASAIRSVLEIINDRYSQFATPGINHQCASNSVISVKFSFGRLGWHIADLTPGMEQALSMSFPSTGSLRQAQGDSGPFRTTGMKVVSCHLLSFDKHSATAGPS